MARHTLIGVGFAGLLVAAGAWWLAGAGGSRSNEPAYRTAAIDAGRIVASVRATGTMNPVTTVLVGSQLSGQIIEINADFNSPVKAGQVIAKLFSEQIRSRRDAAAADLAQGRADLAQRRAQLDRVRATRQKAEATLRDQQAVGERIAAQLAEARRNNERQKELTSRGVGSATALEASTTQLEVQTATLASNQAQVAAARAELVGLDADIALAQAQVQAAEAVILAREAKLKDIEIDLGRTDIRSPVDGVVVQKQIELGQTVAASLNAPTLFTIAQDLSEIDIYANVDETDVGRIREGQPVSFTVNAYPERVYRGRVKMVRLAAQTVQNVVTYTAIVSVQNRDMTLLPGMTANLQILTEERGEAVRIPNAALRFRPSGASAPAQDPGQGMQAGAGPAAMLDGLQERIGAEVKPTAEQQATIAAIIDRRRDALASRRQGRQNVEPATGPRGGGDPQARQAAQAEARQRLVAEIGAALDPERRKRFEAMVAGGGTSRRGVSGRVYVLDGAGQPQPVDVRVGVTDGAYTELVSGDLKPGAQVVVGGGPRATAAAPAGPRGPRGPRLF